MPTITNPAPENARETVLIDDLSIEEEIRSCAQEIYERRGGMSGSDVADWLMAEDAVLAREEYRKSWQY